MNPAPGWGPAGPATTVIVASYNQCRELTLTLAALDVQTDRAFDVIVADDGSAPPMADLVDRLRPALGLAVDCVWQPDTGFNKTSVLNLAAAGALARGAELLVVLDSDCIPFRGMIGAYRARARRGEFLAGSVGFLATDASRALDAHAVRTGAHERSLGVLGRARLLRYQIRNRFAPAGRLQRPRIRGGNFAVCAELFRRVDGFDEVYCGYGKEDSDLRNRFRNAGARGISLWTSAIAMHLSKDTTATARRDPAPTALYEAGKSLVRARRGLSRHLAAAPAGPRPQD